MTGHSQRSARDTEVSPQRTMRRRPGLLALALGLMLSLVGVAAPASAPGAAAAAPGLEITTSTSTLNMTAAGRAITYVSTVKNATDTKVTNVEMSLFDSTTFGTFSYYPPERNELEPGESVSIIATYHVTQPAIDALSVELSTIATGYSTQSGTSRPISARSTPVTLKTVADAKFDYSVAFDRTYTESTMPFPGDKANHVFTVTNTGNLTITGLDYQFSTGRCTFPDAVGPFATENLPIPPGATKTFNLAHTITQDQIDFTPNDCVLTLRANTSAGAIPTPSGKQSALPVLKFRAATVTLTTDPITPDMFRVGADITFRFTVTHTGNTTYQGLDLTGGPDAFSGDGAFTGPAITQFYDLLPGGSGSTTAHYTLTPEDIKRGYLTYAPSAAIGAQKIAIEPITVPSTPTPKLTVGVSADRSKLTQAGETVKLAFTITNEGNVTIPDAQLADLTSTGTGTFNVISGSPALLAPGTSQTFNVEYTASQADIDAQTVSLSATSTGTPPSNWRLPAGNVSSVTLASVQTPSLDTQLTADTDVVTQAGQQIVYTATVENTGNVTLTDVFPETQAFSGAGTPSAFVGQPVTLAPGESASWESTYAATAADLALSSIAHTAAMIGLDPNGAQVSGDPLTLSLDVRAVPETTPGDGEDPDGETPATDDGSNSGGTANGTKAGGSALAHTGSNASNSLGFLGAFALAAGALLLVRANARRARAE
ncbi:hypothetical protein ICL81_03430 [Leucobacter sp. cx-328]|uniref:DUF7507 domain-containing protein n=1 Tax=unclassified Leucobacter TaxID=2621730 RepID=UPI00165D6221|nr:MULTISPECIES: hypothetical protein [unclassified Leucobacter]MBC9943579.1 hypothetical protein [Leucobacter sp. cx-328]